MYGDTRMAKKAKSRTRASNGMGSIRQRPDGRWEARYTTPDGRQRSVYAKTEADVTKKLRGQLHEMDSGSWKQPSRMTVAEWMDIWMRDYQSHLTDQSQGTYKSLIRLYIVPVIGSVKLTSLSTVHVHRIMTAMQNKGFSPNYIRICLRVLSSSLNAAVNEAGLIDANPVAKIKKPRITAREYNIVDRDMIPAFVAAARQEELANAIIFLLLTGLRISEQRGLTWDDIDLNAAKMNVRRQLQTRGDVKFISPKDGSSRIIDLTPEAVALLRQQRKTQAEQRLAAGPEWKSSNVLDKLVFRTASGWYIAQNNLYVAVKRVGGSIGLPALHPHDLRHSYAVAALRSGIDVKTVQHNLGHKSAAMTLDTYAAYTTDAGKVGAERFSEYWQDALKNT